MRLPPVLCWLLLFSQCLAVAAASPSIARTWDEEILSAIRIDTPHPPVQARNLFHVSVVMYDAWAAYDTRAVGYLFREKHSATDLAAARREAISYAAYRLLKERYAYSKSASNTLAALDSRMVLLGYDTNNLSLDTSTPAGVGNAVYATVSSFFMYDGALQLNSYADYPTNQGGYFAINPPLVTGAYGNEFLVNINRWQPLVITNAYDQNGFEADLVQKFVGAQWITVRPFALARTNATLPWIDPGPQPRLSGAGDAQFRSEVVEVIRRSSELTPDDGITLDISPKSLGNNTLGNNDGKGYPVNPITGKSYVANLVKRGDFARVLAEFWADGPTSETPPGHWNVIANNVADSPGFLKRIGGSGPVLDDLEWDVKVYFTLNAAVHDAACAAWSLKRYYDGGRPIEFIRTMGTLGQSSDPAGPSYHTNGLPLVSNLIEVVTAATSKPGGRHAGLTNGSVAIYSWGGQPSNPATQYSGAHWILPGNWMPYQKASFVTPAFPGYISGHSTFSRSAAEVLASMTGSPFFPGGIKTYTVSSLSFETGPTQPIQLQWATYYDAADQAGISRLWGGIHVSADDLAGRRVGAQCGESAWNLAQKYFDGSITNTPTILTLQRLSNGQFELRYNTVRGFLYKLQSSTSLNQSFIDAHPFIRATNTSVTVLDTPFTPNRFYRIVTSSVP